MKTYASLDEFLDALQAGLDRANTEAPEPKPVNVRELIIERDALLADKAVMQDQIADLQERNDNQKEMLDAWSDELPRHEIRRRLGKIYKHLDALAEVLEGNE